MEPSSIHTSSCLRSNSSKSASKHDSSKRPKDHASSNFAHAPPPPSDLKLRFSLSKQGACPSSAHSPDQKPWRSRVRDCMATDGCEKGIDMAANSCDKRKDSARDEDSEGGCSHNSNNPLRKPLGSEKYMSMKALAQEKGKYQAAQKLEGGSTGKTSLSNMSSIHDGHGSRRSVSEKDRKQLLTAPKQSDKMLVRVVARKESGSDRSKDVKMSQADHHSCKNSNKDKVTCPSASIMRDLAAEKEEMRRSPSPKHRKVVPFGRLPFKKAFKTMRTLSADDMARKPEPKSSSSQVDRGATRKRSFVEVADDGISDSPGTYAECPLDEFPVKFSHIRKKSRSHRHRRSQEKLTCKQNVQQQKGREGAEVGRQEMVCLGLGDEMHGTNLKNGASADGEGGTGLSCAFNAKEGDKEMVCNVVENTSDMEKTELEHEGEFVVGGKTGEEHNINGSNSRGTDAKVLEEMETLNAKTLSIAFQGYPQKDGRSLALSGRGGDGAKNSIVRDAHIMAMGLEAHSKDDVAPLPLAMEMRNRPKVSSILDVAESMHAEKEDPSKQDNTDKELKTNNELTLSLLRKPGEVSVDAKVEEKLLEAQASESEHGKECSSNGHDKIVANLGFFQLSLGLPGTSVGVEDRNVLGPIASAVPLSTQPERSTPSSIQPERNIPSGLTVPERNITLPAQPEKNSPSSTNPQSQRQVDTETQTQSQTRTNYLNGFSASLSLSSFMHNPSCSLDCASLDNQDISCRGSVPQSLAKEHLFVPQRSWQTVCAHEHDQMSRSWQSADANEQMLTGYGGIGGLQERAKHKSGIPLYQWGMQNGNIHPFPSASASNRSFGSNNVFQMDLGCGPKVLLDTNCGLTQRKIEKGGDCLESAIRRQSSIKAEEVGGCGSSHDEKIGLHEIATEPVAMMAQKMQELPDGFLEGLKCLAKDFLGSFEKREEFLAIQSVIKKRRDLTENILLHAHRVQLEILVALKTGMRTFVQDSVIEPLTYKVLIEIFMETRCRNVECQHPLPVDDCDCKICCQKKGFCHQCMCVVCFNFDSDNQTCRWVGCDFCMHWCHTDCALRMSFIAPAAQSDGRGGEGGAAASEMQFRCAACGRHTELLGFVMGVFREFAGTWDVEALAKELDCVRRIFHGSKDVKGQQLRWKVEELLQNLEKMAEAVEVRRNILHFFDEGIMDLDGGGTSINKHSNPLKISKPPDQGAVKKALQETLPKISSPNRNSKSVGRDKAPPPLQQQNFNRVLPERTVETAYLDGRRAEKRAEIEDIRTMVRMKEAEANMLQLQASKARQEATGLQHAISIKQDKMEEDFTCDYTKLRLHEAEERRRKRMEEMQALEKAQLDYEKMKMRMEAQIKELVVKVGMSKWQCA